MSSRTNVEVIYRKAAPPDTPACNDPGFAPGSSVLPRGSVHADSARPLPCDILLERDVAVALRDGTVIYIDVYRPVDAAEVPAIVAWGPYGKRGGFWTLDLFPDRAGVPRDAVSGLQMFEAPDPAYWCQHGYAVINPDARGAFKSGGDIQHHGRQEGRDGCDLVEWVATRPWCSGRVGLAGNGWLAIAQWWIASERPPHLAAIAPWEGFTDAYRDYALRGGIPSLSSRLVQATQSYLCGENRVEDVPAMIERYPLMNEYWEGKIVDLERVEVPAYVVASWTSPLQTRGTLDAFRRIRSREKWLRVHNTQEWPDLYANQDDLRRFFDHYLKDEENGWESTPRVRLSVLDLGGSDQVDRPATEWPPSGVELQALHLDASTRTLAREPVGQEAQVRYRSEDGQAAFVLRFDQDTELIGPMSVRLWVEAVGSDDMDLFVYVQKLDDRGELLLTDVAGHTFFGARGQLRVSHRQVDPDLSTPTEPYLTHRQEERLSEGQIVAVDVPIWPLGMLWHRSQQLRLLVCGHDLLPPDTLGVPPDVSRNCGEHVIHAGGRYDSHLVAPIMPRADAPPGPRGGGSHGA